MARADRALAATPALATWLALALALAAAAPALAAVGGTPHDLIAQGYDVPRTDSPQERCAVCHLSPAGRGLLGEVPLSLRGRYGPGSLTCFSCHDGITLVSPEVDASLTAFHPAGHGQKVAPPDPLQDRGESLPGAGADLVECGTCHDPHENSQRPFLRAPLGELCLSCHSTLAGAVIEGVNSTGNHPVGADPAEMARREMPLRIGGEFAVAFPFPYPLQGGRDSPGTHWDLGGHLLQGATGRLGCVTCHAVHADEGAAPAPALLTVDPVREVADLFCEGCHRGQRGDGGPPGAFPNPGGTTLGRTYHPCDDDSANGEGRLPEIVSPADWPLGGGTPPRLLCTTCHTAHGAKAGSRILRPPVKGLGFCQECHEQLAIPHHHPCGESTGPCASLLPVDSETGGRRILGCDRCHRAHNAGLDSGREAEHVPLLRTSLADERSCVSCHPAANPTCGTDSRYQASHFLGDPTLLETYDDRDPPLWLEMWPESTQASRYGGASGKAVTCLSCHSFRPGQVVSGDDGTARYLLARSGNRVEWTAGQEQYYLCTGCHGATPGTGSGEKGHTHPLMEADAAALGTPVAPPLSATPTGKVNCDSCHRPHGASTSGGVYILETIEGLNTDPRAIKPQINFTPTCLGCHEKY